MSDSSPHTLHGYFLSVTVENVRCFRAPVTLYLSNGNGRPAQWTVILGDNGTGKTTLLQAIATVRPDPEAFRVDHGLEAYLTPAWGFDWRPYVHTDDIETLGAGLSMEIAFSSTLEARADETCSTSIEYRSVASGEPDRSHGDPESLPQQPNYTCHVFAYGGYRRLPGAGTITKETSGPVASLFDAEARLINPEDWYLQRDYAANNPRNTDAMRAAAATSRDLVAKVLTTLLPDVSALEPVTTDARSGTTELHAHTPYGRVRVRDLGLGYQSTLAWVVDLAARMVAAWPDSPNPLAEPAVCLVDEIDLHLHPRWQRTLLGELSKHFPNVQFVVTAHSPLIVQGAPDANLAVLRRRGGAVTLDNDPVAVRNWRVDQILTSDLFGLEGTRNPETDALIAKRDRLLAKSRLTAADEAEVARLEHRIGELPQGETREQQEAMELILRAAAELKARDAPKKKASGANGATAVIRIHRSPVIPAVLVTLGAREDRRNCRRYRKHRDDYRAGTIQFDFRARLYAHASVKAALRAMQHDKCAFCEAKITHIAYGDVEHFRPKGGYRQRADRALMRPGYYWLAYAWENLLLSCQLCNQRFKANHFPLEKGSPRARYHGHDVARERPMFINPAEEDPTTRIGFRMHVPHALNADPRAKRTIRRLGLTRMELNRHREEHLKKDEMIFALAQGHPKTSLVADAHALLARMAAPEAQYSLMVRTWLRARGMQV
jgi:uncharacterized protein (TIGR02646 family)